MPQFASADAEHGSLYDSILRCDNAVSKAVNEAFDSVLILLVDVVPDRACLEVAGANGEAFAMGDFDFFVAARRRTSNKVDLVCTIESDAVPGSGGSSEGEGGARQSGT